MTDDVHRWWRCPLSANRAGIDLYPDGESQPQRAAMDQRQPAGQRQDRIGYIIYSAIELPDALWAPETPKRNLVLATFFEMRDVYNGDAAYGRTYFQYLGTTPGLAPASDGPHEHGALEEVDSNVRFGREGVLIDTWCQDGWAAGYLVPYDRFFEAARWQPLSFVGLLLLCVVGSIVLYRRHRNLVVRPAQASHERVVESDPSTAP